ncbi:hypothetical protein Fmac_012356 [Flemingia macrophylla]|uniref:PGG domain-containing protein n=1 Tax=Flemingia macrophylla TaxID=520843 RepID=A0ABD1MS55_9FABA
MENGMSLPTSMVGRNRTHDGQNWLEERRGSLMVVATVIATMTFQIAINPPGGVWQSKADSGQGCARNKPCDAGTSVLASGNNELRLKYEMFILLCTVSFSASLTTILLLICGISLRNIFIMWFLVIVMFISVICTAGAYVICILMVLKPVDKTINYITIYYAYFWGGFTLLMCFVLFCRFVFWLLKKLFRFLCCCK